MSHKKKIMAAVLVTVFCVLGIGLQTAFGKNVEKDIGFEFPTDIFSIFSGEDTNAVTEDVTEYAVESVGTRHIGEEENVGMTFTDYIDHNEMFETVTRRTNPPPVPYSTVQDVLSNNPERGFYSSSKPFINENGVVSGKYVETASASSKLLQMSMDLSAFSGSMNGTGVDKELTPEALSAIDKIFNDVKQNDNTLIFRMVYDNAATEAPIPGISKVEPSQAMLLRHIEQLGPLFRKYSSTISIIQIGCYGVWGEAYYSTDAATRPDMYMQTVQKFLDVTKGTDILIAVRTPMYYTYYKGISLGNIDSDITTVGDDSYRVCVFNDGYGGSDTDLGTYGNRQKETDWLANQNSHNPYGGEAVAAGSTNPIGDYNKPEFFINEAFKIHTSYLNWEWNQAVHSEWAARTYTGDDPVYAGKDALTYIESHLGYRFVIREAKVPDKVSVGGILPITLGVENVGFGNMIKDKRVDIIITTPSQALVKEYNGVDIDVKKFLSGSTVRQSINLSLPSDLSPGTYEIHIRVSSGEKLDNGLYYSVVRFANNKNIWGSDIWNRYFGSQSMYLGQFVVE